MKHRKLNKLEQSLVKLRPTTAKPFASVASAPVAVPPPSAPSVVPPAGTYHPTGDRVHYEREMPASEGPIVGIKADPLMSCKVLAVGPKVTSVKPGDRVLIAHNADIFMPYGTYTFEREVMAILE